MWPTNVACLQQSLKLLLEKEMPIPRRRWVTIWENMLLEPAKRP